MADTTQEDRTEEATPRKRQEARTEGRIPRSQELNTAFLLLGGALVLNIVAPRMGELAVTTLHQSLFIAGSGALEADSAITLLRGVGWKVLSGLGTVLLMMTGVALSISTVQARGILTSKPIQPQWERINPLPNMKRMLGMQPWMELFKSFAKLLIVGIAVHFSLRAAWGDVLALAQQSAFALPALVRQYSVRLLMTAGLSYLVLALLDYLYQLWDYEKNLRMSKHEVKQEHKQSDGDPLMKQRLRSMGRAMARRQMFQEVPTADVVITNPTHIAVALRYDPNRAEAPVVLAMGQRKVAERIKAIAAEAGVPMIENKPVARALLANARVGMMIPAELYLAVAEVLAFVLRQRSAGATSWKTAAAG